MDMDEDYDAEEQSEEEAGSPGPGDAADAPGDAAGADDDGAAAEPAAASTPGAPDRAAGEDDEPAEEGGDDEQADDEFDDAFDEEFEADEGGDASQAQDQDQAADDAAAAEEPAAEQGEEPGPSGEAERGTRTSTEADVVARKKRIMDSLTEQQLDRYESFRRSSLARPKMKKLVSSLLGYTVNDKSIIALCGMGKVFVGELVETARVLAAEEGYHGPLLPRHIHWAYQNLNCERKIPRRQPAKRLLR